MTRDILRRLENMPAVALLGPRQCGKSTLARHIHGRIGRDLHPPHPTSFLCQPEKRLVKSPKIYIRDTGLLHCSGVELDLVLKRGTRTVAIECKATTAPRPTRGFWQALQDLGIDEAFIVSPASEGYPIERGVRVVPLHDMIGFFSA